MSKQYYVNDYLVDTSRNQICYQEQNIALPKKALAVLTLLAENVDSVVSHDMLMEAVWTNSIVAPNTLQRSIAQLRKAFNDDSKQQSVIQTHAKQGYSLAAKVHWLENKTDPPKNGSSNSATIQTTKPLLTSPLAAVIILLSCILLVITWFSVVEQTKPLHSFSKVVPITATDAKESNAIYSKDGRYLVFHRYQGSYQHHIWAKDLTTLKEYRLTEQAKYFGSHGWSEDGNQLTFIVYNNKTDTPWNNDETCWQLHTLDFAAALRSPQPSSIRVDCTTKRMAIARWLPNGNVGLLKQSSDDDGRYRNILQSYNLRNGQFFTLYNPAGREIYSYDFSFKSNTFAVITRTKDNQHIVEQLAVDGEVLSSALIVLENKNSAHEYYNVYYHPSGEYLLTSTEMGVFQLFFDGSLQQIQSLGHRNLSEPSFHPHKSKFVAIQETGDQDIATVELNVQEKNESGPADGIESLTNSFARSNSLDVNAKYQPNGHLIAYNSTRSGDRQLWLYDGNTSIQLSRLDSGIQSMNFVWSPNGDEIATVSGDKLLIFSLDGKVRTIKTSMAISKIMQWGAANQMVVIANQDNINNVFRLTLNEEENTPHSFTDLMAPHAKWAKVTPNNELLYIDSSKNIWIKKASADSHEKEQLTVLNNQFTSNRLTLKNNVLYGINHLRQLWRYPLSSKQFQIINQLPSSARYVSDVNKNKALITQTIRHNKEIIEFN